METLVNLTELEKEVLLAIYWSDYQDDRDSGAEGVVDNPVWYLDASDVKMKPEQLSGAVSSCVKKGFVGMDKDGRDSTIWLTQEGYRRIEGEI